MSRFLSNTLSALCVACALSCWPAAHSTPPPAPAPAGTAQDRKPNPAFMKALELLDIKLQMTESSHNLQPSPKTLAALIAALEEYVNTACMAALPKTLEYQGSPSDPNCVARMEQLLKLNPGNPAALCARDGIQAESCLRAYRGQVLERYERGSSKTTELSEVDLKAGLSATDKTRLEDYQKDLERLQATYEQAQSNDDRQKALDDAAVLYERTLGIACRVFGLELRERHDPTTIQEPEAIAQVRQKLLKVPVSMREDYQLQVMHETEAKLENPKLSPKERDELEAILSVAKDPENRQKRGDNAALTRVRLVLPQCYTLIEQSRKALPGFPASVCYAEGWYTPQCVLSLRQWRSMLIQRHLKAKSDADKGAAVTPKVISQF